MTKTLLWVNHVPLCCDAGTWVLDLQTTELISHLLEEFDRIILGCIYWEEFQTDVLSGWQAIDNLPWKHRLEILALPCAYSPLAFARHYGSARAKLSKAITQADYLCFLPASMIGDWPGVACLEAIGQGRPFAMWNDRVERDVIQQTLSSRPWWQRGITQGIAIATGWYNHALMKRATLGLLQGDSCRTEFERDLQGPGQHLHCFNYINTRPEDAISPGTLAAKLQSLRNGEPLRIGYVGRVEEMKGPLDWLAILALLRDRGIDFQATWVGDGLLLAHMQQQVIEQDLGQWVTLLGAVRDRQQVLSLTRQFHLILCCHRTAESARCLQEALVCGSPIVAYDSAYVAGLLGQYACGASRPIDDHVGMADLLQGLDSDRQQLRDWTSAAATAGASLNAEATFRQVGRLIKQHVGSPQTTCPRVQTEA